MGDYNNNMHLEVFNLTNLLGECVGGDALHVAAGDHKRSEHTPKIFVVREGQSSWYLSIIMRTIGYKS